MAPTIKTEEIGGFKPLFEKEISDFAILTELGGGAFGTVYLA